MVSFKDCYEQLKKSAIKKKIGASPRRKAGKLVKVVEWRRKAQICVFFGLSTYFFGERFFNRGTNLIFDQRDDPQFFFLEKKRLSANFFSLLIFKNYYNQHYQQSFCKYRSIVYIVLA